MKVLAIEYWDELMGEGPQPRALALGSQVSVEELRKAQREGFRLFVRKAPR